MWRLTADIPEDMDALPWRTRTTSTRQGPLPADSDDECDGTPYGLSEQFASPAPTLPTLTLHAFDAGERAVLATPPDIEVGRAAVPRRFDTWSGRGEPVEDLPQADPVTGRRALARASAAAAAAAEATARGAPIVAVRKPPSASAETAAAAAASVLHQLEPRPRRSKTGARSGARRPNESGVSTACRRAARAAAAGYPEPDALLDDDVVDLCSPPTGASASQSHEHEPVDGLGGAMCSDSDGEMDVWMYHTPRRAGNPACHISPLVPAPRSQREAAREAAVCFDHDASLEPAPSGTRQDVPRIFRGTSASRCMGKRYSDGSAARAREINVRAKPALLLQERFAGYAMDPRHEDCPLITTTLERLSPFGQLTRVPARARRGTSAAPRQATAAAERPESAGGAGSASGEEEEADSPSASDERAAEDGSGQPRVEEDSAEDDVEATDDGEDDAEAGGAKADGFAADDADADAVSEAADDATGDDVVRVLTWGGDSEESSDDEPASGSDEDSDYDASGRAGAAPEGTDRALRARQPAGAATDQPSDAEADESEGEEPKAAAAALIAPQYPPCDRRYRPPANLLCEVCRRSDRWDGMLLCDECCRGFHWWCLDHSQKSWAALWFCNECKLAKKELGYTNSDYLPLSKDTSLAGYTAPPSPKRRKVTFPR